MRFDAVVHARPSREIDEQWFEIRGRKLPTLLVAPESLDQPFPVSFEEALDRMDRLPQLLIELDGSFVWSGVDAVGPWQLDGTVHDRNGRLLYVTVKGSCRESSWEQLLDCFGWPQQAVVIQSVREAVYFEEPQFRVWASSDVAGV